MNILSSHNPSLRTLSLALMALMLTLATPPAEAQTAGVIHIGGKVYGGGKNGAIGTSNTSEACLTQTDSTQVTVTSNTLVVSDVQIHSGNIKTVFGGGEQGRSYGKTTVSVSGGTIGIDGDADLANGNVFGAGDGWKAHVYGGSSLLVTGGTIMQSVYGGGNEADLMGSTLLTLRGGTYVGAVYGGAKLANIYGRTFVNVDGEHATDNLHIIDVYGGNDIAGEIQPSEHWTWTQKATVEASLPTLYDGSTFTLASTPSLTNKPTDVVDGHTRVTGSWNAFVLATKGTTHKTLIDNVYGGGNGDYDYASHIVAGNETNPYAGKKKPVIGKTYLQIEGGMYGSLYGGGNAATVSESTDICLINDTEASETYLASLTEPSKSRYSSDYAFNRVFGGNNKEPMAIRPNWYLEKATVNNLYSGGNAGPMTYFKQTSTGAASLAGDGGIILYVESDNMEVNNVYGGCRMADVNPIPEGVKGSSMTINPETFGTVNFQSNYAARVLITGGNINNVYGGNDVSGNVYFGSQVEILSSINGDVYGAGNGSYPYTDQASWVAEHPEDADYYYDPSTAAKSVEALNNWRPNAEKTWVHVAGKDVGEPTVIGGSLYCGGNSATLRTNGGSLADAKAHLQIGSYVICNQVFQGSNGVNMISEEMLTKYAAPAFSSLNLTSTTKSYNGGTATEFDKYMEGVEVAIQPEVAFDADYADHSARFGSLYCGGNVGSMSADGLFTINFLNSLLIYDKLVAGSNSANVPYREGLNAFHLGGLIGAPDAASGNKVELNISGLKLEPRVLNGSVKTGFNLNQWHYVDPEAEEKMLAGANIYGGCYDSGYINGGVTINITENAISDMVADSGVLYETIQNDVLASTLSVYGGGYGPETEIWGNTTINITGNGQIMKAYGGGEMGVVGKLDRDVNGAYGQELDPYEPTKPVQEWYSQTTGETLYGYNTFKTDYLSRDHYVAKFAADGKFNATVNLNANLLAADALNVAKLYGGGFQGTISGNTIVNLNKGRVYDAFGGASNADILGHTEMYVGKSSAPTVTHNVYGANDFGGLIVGYETYHVDNNKDGDTSDTMEKIIAQSYVEYSAGNIAGDLFGGPCGAYYYDTDAHYTNAIAAPNFCKPQLLKDFLTGAMLTPLSGAGYAANSFVNVISQSTLSTDVIGGSIFGAGQGLKGSINLADERGSYVRLMSATKSQRSVGELSQRVYGAGYCSNTNRSLVDAYTGYYKTLFGGAHGITYQELTTMQLNNPAGHYETNYMGYRSAVRLHEMANNEMDIYGGGANAGADETGVVLNGGEARYVYGASYAQGISYASSVEVPTTSTSHVKAIFGGAEGGQDNYPCDAYNTFVTWKSPNARVQDAIYGGNNAFRMTRNAYVTISAPVKNFNEQLTNVFGGGYGPETVTLYTSIGLQEGAQVANVYGGGNNGQVLDTPSFRYYLDDGQMQCSATDTYVKPDADGKKTYPASLNITADTPESDKLYGYQKYLRDTEVIGFHRWIYDYCWDGHTLDDRGQPIGSYLSKEHGHAHSIYFLSTQQPGLKNTNIFIQKGALVAENAYGGGLGAQALVSGETGVHLMGGTVRGDIYGGGQEANVAEYPHLIFPAGGQYELTMSSTNVDLQGGIARNVYGGGLKGRVTGSTNVILGTKDQHEFDFYGTRVAGQYEHQTFYGDPIVERSLYGGGEMGPVHGTAYLTLNQGHVGYKYDASKEADNNVTVTIDGTPTTVNIRSNKNCYVENLDLYDEGDNFLDQNGNVFGAGYGEGASVDVTYVNIYGGTVRNSLYGGGEIAAVGRATMQATGAHPVVNKPFDVAGRTHVYMYNGLVQGDVFGGGRGYSYDLTGNEVIGKELYTDGYIFGTTDVEIRGGTIGTPETVEDGHGNVFGGGNIGYCFTDAMPHDGRYYTNAWKCNDAECGFIDYCHNAPTVCGKCGKSTSATDPLFVTSFTHVDEHGASVGDEYNEKILSEDCRVVISPYAQVKPGQTITILGNGSTLPDGTVLVTKTFQAGEYVPTYYLDLLKDKNTDKAQWDKLSDAGVTVRNAVFAGGNVSSGSDKVYANAITVFGNATASVNDVFFRDFVSIGTENVGGIYGDGNLTFVDGYRELNITDYGTDYYGQQDHITLDEYNAMNDRERAYFELEYQAKSSHTYEWYSCNTAGKYGDTEYVRNQHISVATYNSLPDGDKSHWTHHTKTYDPNNSNDRIKQSEWALMTIEEKDNWEMFGFCSIYAGRLLNTIQRADFCGVFGSRLVLEGAQDRVPEVVDYTQYTLNRVGELSLNKSTYKGSDTTGLDAEHLNHGNYFGMYSIVNYLGAITSDVAFTDVRTTDNTNSGYKDAVDTPSGSKAYGTATFYDWKKAHQGDRKRNNGTCHNTVALAAGVYLELVEEPKTAIVDPNAPKDYGYITGVVQLDLINVMTGLGGGYVYAKNEHGAPSGNPAAHENLSIYNAGAVNNSAWAYDEHNRELVETSGNFIHNTKQIVDDCFPRGGDLDQPAHYWYIRGEFYVYDQYISAFTGSSTAYQENINLPLTITAGANGRLDLIDIKQNFYAYYKEEGNTPLTANEAFVVNNKTYGLNDVITWWDYMQLTDQQKLHFVPETLVATMDYSTTGNFDNDGKGEPVGVITKGEVILPNDKRLTDSSYKFYDPEEYTTNIETGVKTMKQIAATDVFHTSNAVSHANGYVLAVSLDNPGAWDTWYSPESGAKKLDQTAYQALKDGDKTNYRVGPTYYPTASGVYGQHQHVLDEIVTKTVVTAYNTIPPGDITALESAGKHQATVAAAYVAVTAATYDYDHDGDPETPKVPKNVQAGVGISATEYDALSDENKAKFSPAYTCTSTFEEDPESGLYVYFGELIPATRYQDLKNALVTKYTADGIVDPAAAADQAMRDHFDNAYIVTTAGLYGGQRFNAGYNYRALDTWATLSAEDRQYFEFRYDALDALLLSDLSKIGTNGFYPGTGEEGPGENNINLYDGPYWDWTGDSNSATPNHQVYGAKQPIDYTAKYEGSTALTWTDAGGTNHTLTNADPALGREIYENLPNEQRHYSAFTVSEDDKVAGSFPQLYIVKESFVSGGTHYAAGKFITPEIYASFDSDRQAKIETFTPTAAGTYYICRESYTIGEKGMGERVTNLLGSAIDVGSKVPSGAIISADDYSNLVNKQAQHFVIHGNSPIETSTFYVNRESDINDLSKDRIVTVVYQYKYEESDESGLNIEEITERHIVNIHITFKSGVPTIGKLQEPSIVLPGQTVGLKSPNVSPGAYEILGGGWELFTNPEDAEKHTNGKTYVNNATPMYWYQDGYYVAYYAKTYLGKTYSNSVPFKVANYHDIADVMAHPDFMYIDNPNVKRNSKIYIDNSYTDENPDATKSEIDMLYDLFDKSLNKPANEKTVYVDVQRTNSSGEPLYYRTDTFGNKIEDEPFTITPTAYPVTDPVPQQVQVINNHTRNCANLDFYLGDNVRTIKAGGWEPIGTEPDTTAAPDSPEADGECFMGTVHGMGYTISGLQQSLFGQLCGYVYNLGVTGTFTKSGVADRVKTAKVPDSGDPGTQIHGHVNSCWIYTNADPAYVVADAGNPAKPYCPVVGTANDLSLGVAGIHVLNCYFPEECGYPMGTLSRGPNTTANSTTLRQFNNGEVTYDLNGFYLNKRYSDATVTKADYDALTGPMASDKATYKYWTQDSEGNLAAEPSTGYYLGGGSMHAYRGENLGYVERLFADGDFVYKHGTIPLETNERYSTAYSRYLPVWPDDYYFFGQQLSYGYDEVNRPYQPVPSHARKTIAKDGIGHDERLVTTEQNNIVYRIPAYFRSSEKRWAHFNPYAVFADKMKEGYTTGSVVNDKVLDGREVHPGLTALDFSGFNDRAIMVDAGTKNQKFIGVDSKTGLGLPKLVFSNGARNIAGIDGYSNTLDTHGHPYDFSPLNDGAYFGPITDYTTIVKFETHGITQNLLTYAPTPTFSGGTSNTLDVLKAYYNEPVYADHYDNTDGYRKVDALDASTISSVHGHLIFKENNKDLSRHYYYAASDHYLVDKQDFNAPIEYEFNATKKDANNNTFRMWYQRTPDNYADMNEGWEGVSIPFRAELVTTQQKGEITHFYNSALGADYNAGKTSGHEYWLREFTGVQKINKTDPDRTVTTACMNYPVELEDEEAYKLYGDARTKTVANTFLWDYYYNADGKDANSDDYRHEYDSSNTTDEQDRTRYYYGQARSYKNYPLSVAGRPYIVGFPGGRYYEFDLSGTFVPEHSGATTPSKLAAQTISFVSDTGITIRVSDDELADANAGMITHDGYTFYSNYLNVKAPAADEMDRDYTWEEYNTVKGTSYTEEQFNALPDAYKRKDHIYFKYYVLNNEGSSFDLATTPIAHDGTGGTPIAPFRPFFATDVSAPLNAPQTRSIVFGKGENTQFEPDEQTIEQAFRGGLKTYVKKNRIYVESGLTYNTNVRIVSAAGVTISTFEICPGERVETAVDQAGVYLVNHTKVLVK